MSQAINAKLKVLTAAMEDGTLTPQGYEKKLRAAAAADQKLLKALMEAGDRAADVAGVKARLVATVNEVKGMASMSAEEAQAVATPAEEAEDPTSALAKKHGVSASILASPLTVDLIESYDYMQSQREGLVEVMTKHLPNPMPPADASRMMVRRRRLEVDRGQWH